MSDIRRELPAWGVSLLLNGGILLACHFIAWTVQSQAPAPEVVSVMEEVVEPESVFLEAVVNDQLGVEGETLSLSPVAAVSGVSSTSGSGATGQPLQQAVEEIVNPVVPNLVQSEIALPQNTDFTATVMNSTGTGVTDKVKNGATGVMDRLTFEIRQSVRERQTLVIWIFDASLSMRDRRNAIAKRFTTVYQQLDQEKATDGLYTAVLSYGEKVNILTPEPVKDVAPLINLVEKIPDDSSGKEVVFEAVGTAVEKWRTFRKNDGAWNKLVFIVTDERGDDAEQYLESVIATCKRTKTRVFTMGNAAIFGQKHGFVRWVSEDGIEDYLPVDQGPETAYPEGLQLPSWGDGGDWQLRQMSSSYGPYALTRLSSETGGMYLIAEESRGRTFDQEVMRNYSPDYRPLKQAEEDIRRNAAKTALVTTAELTYDEKKGIRSLPVPTLAFAAYNDNVLRSEIVEAQKPVAQVDYDIKRLLASLETGEKDRERIREPRWRAAYDLAMGRLLALRARYFGYNNMLAAMRTSPRPFTQPNTNEWVLRPSDQVDSVDVKKIAEKARKYLQRVIDEHSGTPWALLAEKELRMNMGWSWSESARPVPPGMQARGLDDAGVARLLLAEEEERKRQPAAKKAPTRVLPKL
ncbi:MAG: vWA domain-containing protein [Planctomycetaceae bacterium]